MIKEKVGLEVEYLMFNTKDDAIIPPSYLNRDDFPLLGEIRGDPSDKRHEILLSFQGKKMKLMDDLRKGHTIKHLDSFRVPLKLYKEANKQVEEKNLGDIKNIHGVDISDFSDQVIKNNKIQGINISCGLHVHFSCEELRETEYRKAEYERVDIPLHFTATGGYEPVEDTPDLKSMRTLLRPSISLWKKLNTNYDEEPTHKLTCRASRLNRAAIYYIVEKMDETFFEKLTPEKGRTKYRQPGFYEIKPYGFEYRSLPANEDSMRLLPEIVQKALDLLEEINS